MVKQIAIFNQDGFHAMDDLCVHQDGSIAPGKLQGDIVECPLHFWKYNIKTGELVDYLKDIKLETYSVQSRDDGPLRRHLKYLSNLTSYFFEFIQKFDINKINITFCLYFI